MESTAWPCSCVRAHLSDPMQVIFPALSLPQVRVPLPPPPPGHKWCRVVDTALPAPRDITPGGNKGVESSYGVQPYSAILLVAKQE